MFEEKSLLERVIVILKKIMFYSTSKRVRSQNIGTVGVPQIFINAQRYIASDSLAYTEILTLHQKILWQKWMRHNFNKIWNRMTNILWSALGVHFNLTKFQRKCFFLLLSVYITHITPPSKTQTESSNSDGVLRQYNLQSRRIQSEDTTVVCCCFRNCSQFIKMKNRSFSACSFNKFRYFPYLSQEVKNWNCLSTLKKKKN